MKKTMIVTIEILCLLLSLYITTIGAVGVQKVEAENIRVVYCPTLEFDGLNASENNWSLDACEEIYDYLITYGDFSGGVYCVDTAVTRNNVGFYADYCEDYYDYTAVFFKGHGGISQCQNWQYHYNLIDTYNGSINDTVIISGNTTQNEHDFVFLWACRTSDIRGSDCACGYARGMPYAWTHDSDLAPDGYHSPDTDDEVFLGFVNGSPDFTRSTGYDNYYYRDFAVAFYKYLLRDGESVNDALDSASQETIGYSSFSVTELDDGYYVQGVLSRMRIYGNGNLGLPT